MGVAHVMRDVFLDNGMDEAAVIKQLMPAERAAASKGQAIAIGHPHPATIAAIRAWMPKAEAAARRVRVIHLTHPEDTAGNGLLGRHCGDLLSQMEEILVRV